MLNVAISIHLASKGLQKYRHSSYLVLLSHFPGVYQIGDV